MPGANRRPQGDLPGRVRPIEAAGEPRPEAAYEIELVELRDQAQSLEEEVLSLRRRMQDAPKRVRTLEEKLLETKGQLQQAISQNERLTFTLREAREHIAALREEVDKLTQPPCCLRHLPGQQRRRHRGRLLRGPQDAGRAAPRDSRTPLSRELERGSEVVLNESLNVVLARSGERSGEIVTLKELLDDGRAMIVGRADEERVVELADQPRPG